MDASTSSNMQQEARQVGVTTRLQARLQGKRSQQKRRITKLRASTCGSPSCGPCITVEKAQKKTPEERRKGGGKASKKATNENTRAPSHPDGAAVPYTRNLQSQPLMLRRLSLQPKTAAGRKRSQRRRKMKSKTSTPKKVSSGARRHGRKPKSKVVGNPTGGIIPQDNEQQNGIPQEVQHWSRGPNLFRQVCASFVWFLLICFIFSVLWVYFHHVYYL